MCQRCQTFQRCHGRAQAYPLCVRGARRPYNDRITHFETEAATMPIHDWTRVDAGIFHDFHHEWISTLRRSLNAGLLPPDHYALAEQIAGGLEPDKAKAVVIHHISDHRVVAVIEIVSPGNKNNRHG